MNNQTGSTTAVGAAALRAAHQLFDKGDKLLTDEVILRLLSKESIEHLNHRKQDFFRRGSIAMRTHIVLRSRYAEDCLYEAHWRGIRQYLLLGAGIDTFAWRQPAWAHNLHIIEADHPSSQANKLNLLKNAGLTHPKNLSFLKIDLENDDLTTTLANSPLDPTKPVFVSCLGVLIYLRRPTVTRIFQALGRLPKDSEFVFTASAKRWSPAHLLSAARVAAAGEPWLTYFRPSALEEELRSYGFTRIDWLTPEEATRRYWTTSTISLPPPGTCSLVRAVV
ncbi:MAG: class I SAM-dependent methyltransferase [Bacteroidetes bacterium]|nr:class I SAM-dependent methyltransferase [Bacteroidota bacterium]